MDKFLALPEVNLGIRFYPKKLLKKVVIKWEDRMKTITFSRNKSISECLSTKWEEVSHIYVVGIGLHLDEEILRVFFWGLESEFGYISQLRAVFFQQGTSSR